jgi:hypothetical protein
MHQQTDLGRKRRYGADDTATKLQYNTIQYCIRFTRWNHLMWCCTGLFQERTLKNSQHTFTTAKGFLQSRKETSSTLLGCLDIVIYNCKHTLKFQEHWDHSYGPRHSNYLESSKAQH